MPPLLNGRYRLDALIGGGGMGEVWRAHDEVLDRPVAIKIIRPHLADDDNVRARLRLEAQLAGKLQHPGIVDVFDYGEDEEDGRPVPYLVMPLVDGSPLSMLIAERGALTTGESMAIVSQLAAALQEAHDAGIVHRDIKPSNILVTPDGRVMLVDFGIAHAAGGEPLTQTGTLVGTADYLSPEQASGSTATPASDLYSLGVVGYICLSGALPFHRDRDIATALAHLRDDVPPLPDAVPPEASSLIYRMLAKKPDERPPSGTAVAEEAGALATAVPPPTGEAPDLAGPPTQPIAAARPDDTLPGIVERPVAVDDTPTDSPTVVGAAVAAPSPRRPRRMALLSSVLLVVVAGLGWMLLGGGADAVTVPDVDGLSVKAATAKLDRAGLEVEVRKVDAPKAKAGEVVKQDPEAGTEADEGSTVTLSVATGRVRVPVDDLVGATYDEAVATLDKLGLKATPLYAPDEAAFGTVFAVDPSGTAAIGSTVTLSVANGATPLDSDDDTKKGPGKKDKKKDKPGQGKGKDKPGKGKPGKGKPGPDTKPQPTEPAPTTTEPPPDDPTTEAP